MLGDDKLFKSIGEVSTELDIPTHILRFWEDNFKEIKPVRRRGGRRYYHTRDVALLHTIKDLLYQKGYTIKGAQKYLRYQGKEEDQPQQQYSSDQMDVRNIRRENDEFKAFLRSIYSDLKSLKDVLS